MDKDYKEALDYHKNGDRPGKIAIKATKSLNNQKDLSLAYSPGVAAPCIEISKDINKMYDYTARGNIVGVVSNGTAILGLGNLGAAASSPVMEGKSVLFKKFADIDAIPVLVSTEDVESFVNTVKNLEYNFGGINLEDIKAPECFIIEKRLIDELDIPVFHDDQHGTAIVVAAGLKNALELAEKNITDIRIVVSGAGAASIACIELLKSIGVKHDNVILCDTTGVIYKGRVKGMNPWKESHAVDTEARTLNDALVGADVFLGLSVAGALSKDLVKKMAKNPIIFALANPSPEIMPHEAYEAREDAIIATGRSDFPNQINNVMGFPYIFRGALDCRAKKINIEMKIAAVEAIAKIAKLPVMDEILAAYPNRSFNYGKEYIIPTPFDSRLLTEVSTAVVEAAMKTKVAQIELNLELYRNSLLRKKE